MRFIKKTHPNKEWANFNRENPNASYEELCDHELTEGSDKISLKGLVQKHLAKEQGYLCCYCNQSLVVNQKSGHLKVRIEHFKPKSIFNGQEGKEDLRTVYANLLAACENDGSKDGGHCDVHKDNEILNTLENPASNRFKSQQRAFYYNKNGKVFSSNEQINQEIGGLLNKAGVPSKGKLNLNHQYLVSKRRGVWDAVRNYITKKVLNNKNQWKQNRQEWRKVLGDKRATAHKYAQEQHKAYQALRKDNSYYPFCEMVIYLLEKKFKELKGS